MKMVLGSVSLLALVQLAVAQEACLGLTTLFPDCALPCVTSAGSQVGCTVSTDLACRCDPVSSQSIQNLAAGCVIAACTKAGELGSALAAGPSICSCVATAVPETTTTAAPTTTTTEALTTTTTTAETQSTSTLPPDTTTTDSETTVDTTSMITSTASTTNPAGGCDTESPCQASVDAVPVCAQTCISSAAVTNASCDFSDYECQCSSTAVIQNAAQGCVIGGCGFAGAIDVLNAVSNLCVCVEANPTTPCTETATQPTETGTQSTETGTQSTETGTQSTETGTHSTETGTQSTYTQPTETQTQTTETDTQCSETETQTTETQTQTETQTGTTTDTNTGESTCTAGTTQDCGPVASTAIPECAQACFTSAAPGIGCDVDDYNCQCQEDAQSSLSQLLIPCVVTACDSGDLPAIITGASSVCACATAAPPAGDCTTTGGTTETGTKTGTETETSTQSQPPTRTNTETQPTSTKPTQTTLSCTDATTQDCGPVATSAVPSCAHACFSSAAPEVGCGAEDYVCQCESAAQASLSQLLIPCVATACDSGDLPAVITGASSVCACASAEPTGGCSSTGKPPGGGSTTTETQPTKTGTSSGPGGGQTTTTTCADATTQDCGPVATSAVPSCAHACFSSAAPEVGCGAEDYVCQCGSEAQASLSQLLIPCVATACDSGDLAAVITGASSVCACASAEPTGGCSGTGKPPGGGSTTTETQPTKTGTSSGPGGGQTTTCAQATTPDCGPVATSAVPSCAHACFSSAAPEVGCGAEDYACQCGSEAQESLSQLLIPCVATACDSGDLPAVITGASSVCACASAGPTGGCSGTGKPPGGGSTTTETQPTKTTGSGGSGGQTTTCAKATTSDCGPVATSAVPSCAQACFTSAAPAVGCGVNDYACQCQAEAQASLSQLLIPCVATACDSDQLPSVIAGASSVCACATAPPSGGDCGGSTGGGGNGGNPTKSGHSGHSSKPTGSSGGNGGSSTCVPGAMTTADCGPVASSAVPSCAHACFSSAAPKVGCGAEDYACQCGSEAQASLSQLLVPCVATACDSNQLAAVITGASSVCVCAKAAPTGGSGCESGPGGSGGHTSEHGHQGGHTTREGGGPGGGKGEGSITTCVTVTKTGSNGGVTTSFSCYCATGGKTITHQASMPTGESGNHSGSNNGENGSSTGHEGSSGEKPTGNQGESTGSGSESPTETEPAVVAGSAARLEIGLVAGVFGAFWLVAVAL